jgi:hypothetical protein
MLILVFAALLVTTVLPAGAQDVGLYVEVPDSAVVLMKREGYSWRNLHGGRWLVSARDSIDVAIGAAELCVAGGRCSRKDVGEYQISESSQNGIVGQVASQLGRILASVFPSSQPARETFSDRVMRKIEPTIAGSSAPMLLMPNGILPISVLPDSFQLAWLPGVDAHGQLRPTRVEIREVAGVLCTSGGDIVVDTTIALGLRQDSIATFSPSDSGPVVRLDLSKRRHFPKVGQNYYAEVTTRAGNDAACFRSAPPDNLVDLRRQENKLAEALGTKTVLSDQGRFRDALAGVGLLLQEGYSYDALLLLDSLRAGAPQDPFLRTFWQKAFQATHAPEHEQAR